MRAWVLEDIGKFNMLDIEKPQVPDKHVLVNVHAAGICGSDIQRVYENGAHKMPLIIGHEFSGQVEEVGEKVSDKWIGKRVGVFPLIPCKECSCCRNKQYEMCSKYSYLGSRTDGGYAEYVVVPEWNLIELPGNVSYEQAAMLEPMAVAVHAMRRLDIKDDSTIAVCGLGTIGQLLIMFLKEKGIKTIYEIGKGDSTEGICADIYFDCVGKNETAELAFDITSPGGQVCIVGNPYSDMSFQRDLWWKLLRRQIRITGTWNSSFLGVNDEEALSDDWHYVISKLQAGKIHPEKLITHRLGIEELNKGFEIMKSKSEPCTKIMMVI